MWVVQFAVLLIDQDNPLRRNAPINSNFQHPVHQATHGYLSIVRARGVKFGQWLESQACKFFLLEKKKKVSNPPLGWGIWAPGRREFKRANLQKFRYPEACLRWILKLGIDGHINQGNPLQCSLEKVAKLFCECYH